MDILIPIFNIRIGDITTSIEQSMYGRGVEADYKLKKQKIKLIYSKNVSSPIYNSGLKYEIAINKFLGLSTGLSFQKQENKKLNQKLVLLEQAFSLFKNHRLILYLVIVIQSIFIYIFQFGI